MSTPETAMVTIPAVCFACGTGFNAEVPAALVAAGVDFGPLFDTECAEVAARLLGR